MRAIGRVLRCMAKENFSLQMGRLLKENLEMMNIKQYDYVNIILKLN